jgi:hypothetical protein
VRALSARDVLLVWEAGRERHPVDRALLLLAAGLPRCTRDELAALPVGQRDALLLTLRERTLGGTLHCFVRCPQCGGSLEFSADVGELRVVDPFAPVEREHALRADGFDVRFRLLDSRDLAAVAGHPEPAVARRMLLERCVVQAHGDGGAVPPDRLPEPVLARLGAALVERDPQSELEFNLACGGCGHGWAAALDPASFFWTELNGVARRLLRDVHTLASAYGWREADIVAMSAARRGAYLEMLS